MVPIALYIKRFFFYSLVIFLLGWIPFPALADSAETEIPLPARVTLAKAAPLINQKAYDQAMEILTAFQSRGGDCPAPGDSDPKGYHHPEIYFAMGTCHLFQGNFPPAVKAFKRSLVMDPGHISARLNLAKVYCELNDYARAADCFAIAYDIDRKKTPDHLYCCAAAHLMARQYGRSIATFQQLFRDHADEVQDQWRENFVHALLSKEQAKEALPHIRYLAEHYDGEKQIQWQEILLYQYMQLEIHDQALAYAGFLTRQAPTRAKWWQALAHVHLQDSAYESALSALTIYSYLSPLTDQETRLLADLHLQLGIPIKAAPLYEAVLTQAVDAGLLHNLVTALQQLGQPERALKTLNGLVQQDLTAELLMLKADLLYGLERFQEAGAVYRQVADRKSAHKEMGRAWLMAGYAALQIDDVSAGRQAFEKAAAFEKQRKAALLAMQRLPGIQRRPAVRRPSS